MLSMITIVDYGMGNLGSIQNMFKRIGVLSHIEKDIKHISIASKILLPGVGAFDKAMTRINDTGLRQVLDRKALVEKVPILGICLGMQLLTQSSEEGHVPGLGWIPAKTVRFNFPKESNLKIPHIGWNVVERSTPSPLTDGFEGVFRYYFVHSYHVNVEDDRFSILKTTYGYPFDSAIQNDNIFGVQFHPEKSHRFGMKLLENFSRI